MDSKEFKEKVQELVAEKGKEAVFFRVVKSTTLKEFHDAVLSSIQGCVIDSLVVQNKLTSAFVHIRQATPLDVHSDFVKESLFPLIEEDLKSRVAHSLIDMGFIVEKLYFKPHLQNSFVGPIVEYDVILSFDNLLPSVASM